MFPCYVEQKDVEEGWNLRELSLIHQRVLVIAEIAWNPQPSVKAAPVYFVTWEVDGGGLRGNLFTDATSVTLSLWPDTVYHIQVCTACILDEMKIVFIIEVGLGL